MPTIDVTSAEPILRYVGANDKSAADAPPRDLSGNDIGRLAYRRALAPIVGDIGRPIVADDPDSEVYVRPDPREPDPKLVAEIIAELELSGLFEPIKKPKAEKADPPAETIETADAAEEASK